MSLIAGWLGGFQIREGTPHAGRVMFTTTHNSFHGCIVVYTDDGGLTYNYSHSDNLIRLGIDETQIAQVSCCCRRVG
jgi:hypothetical protein